jgi:hypothetical protein
VELAELLDYKPSIEDAYLVLRLASTTGVQDVELDTYGRNASDVAPQIYADYLRLGCIVNPVASAIAPQFVEEGESSPISFNPCESRAAFEH